MFDGLWARSLNFAPGFLHLLKNWIQELSEDSKTTEKFYDENQPSLQKLEDNKRKEFKCMNTCQ